MPIVTRLRKAEKAAAIRIKREEVKALRRALEDSKQKHAISPEPMAEEDNGSEKQEGAHSDLLSVSASSYSMGRSECIHLTSERNAGTRFTKSEEASAEQVTRAGIPTSTMEPARTMKASLSGQIEVKHVQGGGKYLGNPGDRYKFTDPPQQRPPFAGNCPPLTARRLTIEKRQTGENWEGYGERGRDLGPSAEPKASHSETLGIKGGHVEGVVETLDNPFNR